MKFIHVAAGVAVALGATACASTQSSVPADDPSSQIREDGPRYYDGVPVVPKRITERLRQYVNTRSASVRGWSADGGSLYITTRFGETSQLHVVKSPQGARHQISFYDEPVRSVAVPSVAGGSLLVGKDIGGNEAYQIYALDPTSGSTRLLTDGVSRSGGGLWATAGDRFAYQTTQRNGKDWDIHIQLADGTNKALMENEGYWGPLDWSDDDQALVVQRYISINESELWLVNPKTGERTRLNPRDEPVSYGGAVFGPGARDMYLVSDQETEFRQLRKLDLDSGRQETLTSDISWDVNGLRLSPTGRHLAFTVNAGGADVLYLLDLETGQREEIKAPARGRLGGLHFRPDGGALAVALNSALGPGDAWVYEIPSAQWTQWTTSEVGGLDRSRFVDPERITFTSFDQRKLPAFVYRPRDTQGAVPVVVLIHGGPESQFRPYFSPLTQYLLGELGVAVVAPNVRGSAGYGKSNLLLDNGMKREDSVKDIGALLDWIATDPGLDGDRVAVFGGSYGGYMVLASLVHFGDRLKAGIDVVGISNFVTFLKNTKDYRRDLRRAEYGDERNPEMRRFLESISPTNHAHEITLPTFVIQGLNDPRVPASEAEQILEAIRKAGGTAWYMLAKDEGHGFRKKANRDAYMAATMLFIETFLLD